MKRLSLWLPLAIFAILVGFFFRGLSLDPNAQPSALIGKPVPGFQLADLYTGETLTPADFPAEPFLLNVWASWCITCQVEHPYLTQIAEATMPVIGLNYKDTQSAAVNWLAKLGDPYAFHLFDPEGRMGLDLGVAGAPETFLVDGSGIIRARIQGEVNARVFDAEIRPILEEFRP